MYKEYLEGGGVASWSGAFGCFLHWCDCPLGHRSVARLFQHLAFVVRCLSSEPQFASMPIFHHCNALRLHSHGAPHLGAIEKKNSWIHDHDYHEFNYIIHSLHLTSCWVVCWTSTRNSASTITNIIPPTFAFMLSNTWSTPFIEPLGRSRKRSSPPSPYYHLLCTFNWLLCGSWNMTINIFED